MASNEPPAQDSLPALEIQLFGPPNIRVGGNHLKGLHSRKGYSLLALLILRHDREVARDWLSGILWPESTQSRAFYNLRENLADLRRALGAEALRLQSPTRHTIHFDLTGVQADVLEYYAALRRGDLNSLEQAISLSRGSFMEGYGEEWVYPERRALEQSYLDGLQKLAAQFMVMGHPGKAAGYLRQVMVVDPLQESALCRLMEALSASGDHAGVVSAYCGFRLVLHEELNSDPSAETTEMFRRLRSAAIMPLPLARGRGRSGPSRPASARVEVPVQEAQRESEMYPPPAEAARIRREPVGGAVPLDSAFYIVRPADREFQDAVAARDSIVLVKGARQVGKTSLLARGLQQAREQGTCVALTDLQTLNDLHLASADALCLALAKTLALQLDLGSVPSESWDPDLGASLNLEWFVRNHVLNARQEQLVWGLDEVDRLFSCRFGSEIFGLFRSWHNRRALDPTGPWSRLTLAIAYATEAHLFITDLNQSPFNVGTRLTLDDFTPDEVGELNRLYGAPLQNEGEQARFYRLLGGQPFLVRQGFYELTARERSLNELEAQEALEEGPFGDHLRRLYFMLSQDPERLAATRSLLRGEGSHTAENFYRLRSAGVVTGNSPQQARFRCQLYIVYLERRLK